MQKKKIKIFQSPIDKVGKLWYNNTNLIDRWLKEKGEHGYEKALHNHQYYTDGDVHVDLRHVYDLLRSFSDAFSIQGVNPCTAWLWRNHNCLQSEDFIGVFQFMFFQGRKNPIENYFEKLVREIFRFGRMCQCK